MAQHKIQQDGKEIQAVCENTKEWLSELFYHAALVCQHIDEFIKETTEDPDLNYRISRMPKFLDLVSAKNKFEGTLRKLMLSAPDAHT